MHMQQQLKSVLALSEKSLEEFNWQSSSVDEFIEQLDLTNDALKK